MKKTLLLFLSLAPIYVIAQNFESSKVSGGQAPSSQSMIYALPLTNILVTVEVTKTTVRRGIYAEYAEKYLSLQNVPMRDTQSWAISGIDVQPQMEADPSQLYAVTFKTFPERLHNMFSVSRNGIVLDLANTWKRTDTKHFDGKQKIETFLDPLLLEETSREKIDTLYKTVMTDSTFVRIPVFKKQILAKTKEEIIQETANQLIKTRRRKIKLLRGEYDFHPDGAALKVMVEELNKYEESLLGLFAGVKTEEKKHYTFMFIPQTGLISKELGYFNPEKGITEQNNSGATAISIQVNREQDSIKTVLTEQTKNSLYIRAPGMAKVIVKVGGNNMSTFRIPVYQFGTVMVLPMN